MSAIFKPILVLVLIQIASKVLGLLKEMQLARYYGTSYLVDAYTISIAIPSVIFAVFSCGLSRSYLALQPHLKKTGCENYVFSNILNMLFVISIVIAILGHYCSDWLVCLLAPGVSEVTANRTSLFIDVIILSLPFIVVFDMLCVYSYAQERFIFPNFCNFILQNLVCIIFIFISHLYGNIYLVYGHNFSIIIVCVIMFLYIIRVGGLNYKLIFSPFDKNFLKLCRLGVPLGISLLLNQVNAVVDKVFASSWGTGIISALNYANKLQLLPYSFLISTFIVVYVPRINNLFAKGDIKKALKQIRFICLFIIIITIPIVLSIWLLAPTIVQICFERGAFSSNATEQTAKCLALYSLGIPFYIYREVFVTILVANLKNEVVLKNTIVGIIANILCNLIFPIYIGYAGIACATSCAGLISCIAMLLDLNKCNVNIFLKKYIKNQYIECLKLFTSFIIYTIFLYYSFNLLLTFYKPYIATFVSIVLSFIVYFLYYVVIRNKFVILLYRFIKFSVYKQYRK